MAGSSSRNDVVQEISLLYELALAIGTSLDLEVNCETFLRTLVTRKNLDFAAVWLRARHLNEQTDEPQFRLVSACPAFRARADEVPVEPQLEMLQPGQHLTFRAGTPGFEDFAPGGVGVEGTTAVLPIGHLGLLQLYSREPGGFSAREFDQLRSVLRTLATSIEGCLAHRRLHSEVTERRRTAMNLRAATSRLSALITNMQAGVMVEDEHQRMALVNEAFCDLFDIPLAPEELAGVDSSNTAEEVKHLFTDPEGFIANNETLLEGREVVTNQEHHLRDGRILERDYIPIFSDDVFRGHLWQYRDVTERKRAEQEIVRLKNFYEQVLDKMPVQLAVFDTEGRYQYVTPSSVKDPTMREWLIGRTDVDYCHFRNIDVAMGQRRFDALMRVVRTQEEHAYEETFIGRDGQQYHFLRVITPVVGEDGHTVQLLGYGLDITERKRSEQALRESEERFQEVLRSLDAVVWSISITEERLLYINPAAERVYGRPISEFEQNLWLLQQVVHPEDHERVVAATEVFLGELTSQEIEYRIVRPDGEVRWVNGRHTVVRDDEGAPLRVSGFVTDTTDRKQAEEELRRAKQAAEESVRAKERFLANMSHEMRTPLNAVVGMTHLLRSTGPSTEQERYLDGIQFSTDNLLVLINDLLDIAKLEAGKVEFEAVPFDLAALLKRLDDTMQIRARDKDLLLRVEPDEALPVTVLGDPTRLSQILFNLVSNAVKFTEKGEVVVRAEPVEQEGVPAVRFEVRDTGIGIPEEQLNRIFQSFTQAGSDTTRKYGGTGLGLTIVKELVERQHGELAVESTEGVGTTFTVVLPLPPTEQEASAAEDATPGEVDEAALEGAFILLVEDNEMSQVVTARMLRQWGAEVDVASDGEEAVARVIEGAYDLVLMDIQMPGMDGVEATQRIREDVGHSTDELPILALTAASLSDERHAAIEAVGMNDFVFKPFEPEELRRRIAFHLDRARTPPPPPASGEQAVDLSMLERNAFGDEAFVIRMIDIFCNSVPGQLETMQTAAAQQDWQQVRFMAHKLKSTTGMVGAQALREVMLEIEARVDEGRTDTVPTLVGQAAQRGARALEKLEAHRTTYA